MLKLCVLTGDPGLPDPTKRGQRYNEEDHATHEAMRTALEGLGRFALEVLDDHSRLLHRLAGDPPALVLNFCDTGFRNLATQELHIPALLELLAIPYSGATPACMAICYDKQIVRLLAQSLAIPVPQEIGLEAESFDLPLPWPALIKPNQADGSVGISKDAVVHSAEEARAYIGWARRTLPGRALLAQEYLPGPEYGVGLIGNPETGLRALPVLEVDFSGLPRGCQPILSFESKAMPDSPYWTEIGFRPAAADPALLERMVGQSRRLFARLGCRDYARFDFRCAADGEPKLLEVNPNPAWASDGKLALMAGFGGIGYPNLLELIVDAALSRLNRA